MTDVNNKEQEYDNNNMENTKMNTKMNNEVNNDFNNHIFNRNENEDFDIEKLSKIARSNEDRLYVGEHYYQVLKGLYEKTLNDFVENNITDKRQLLHLEDYLIVNKGKVHFDTLKILFSYKSTIGEYEIKKKEVV
jgi:hypothetical protein